ncbi:Ribosomal L1 domain-containing protein [Dirofilaria immitis]
MRTEEDDLIAHLMADNRKLRQLYLAEQQKVLTERKRRITAEARLAALLSKELIERRKRNSSHCSYLDHDVPFVDKTHEDLLKNGKNANSINSIPSSHEEQTASLVMNNIRKHRKKISASKNVIEHTDCSAPTVQNANISENSGKINLQHSVISSEHSINPLSNETNRAQLCLNAKLPQNNFEKTESTTLSKFWSFIDRNGETKSSVPPPLNQIQQKRKEAFIKRSTERQILIQEASACRKELATTKRKIAKQLLAGHMVNRNAVQVLRLMDREIHAFPPQAMKQETIRRIYKTREFQDKKKRQRDQYDVHTNRLLAYCYSRVPYRFQRRTNAENVLD